jgi:MATE family multidrug resistance protein
VTAPAGSWRADVARIAPLAWPVLIGQVAVLMYATVDTVLVARFAAADLAALAVGGAAYITVFIGLVGIVMAIGPLVGQLYGANRHVDAGAQLHQAVWLALGLTLVGSTLLAFPWPFLALARATPEVAAKVRGYLLALAFALPAALLFSAYRGFNLAVSRPKAVMALQLVGLALKVPLSAALVYGVGPLPALGVAGCGIATAAAMWLQALVAWRVLRRDSFYDTFALFGRGLDRPRRDALWKQVKLGVPMGGSVLIEVTGFAFMAFFISRISPTAVAGHQLAANLVSLLFMVPLSLANATSTLVAQRVGAADRADARRIGWNGLRLAALVALLLGSAVFLTREGIVRLYTHDEVIIAAALPLLAWVALFHFVDAMQIAASFVLRGWHIVNMPVLIYVASIWGIGVAGGYTIAFNLPGNVPAALQGARGFWIASTTGLSTAAALLVLYLAWVMRQKAQATPAR